MKIISIIIVINFLFSQGNYQLLNSPSTFKEIFKDKQIEFNAYSFFHSSLPADINFYAFQGTLNNIINQLGYNSKDFKFSIIFESLDYGKIHDNISNYSFNANELLMQIRVAKKINKNISSSLYLGFLESNIENYNANAFLANAMLSYQFLNNIINVEFKNFGKVIKEYNESRISLPSIFSLSYIKNFKPLSIIMNYENHIYMNSDIYSISTGLNISSNLKLYLGVNNNKKDLKYGNYIEDLMSGLSSGIYFKYSDYIFYLATQNLGAAGYSTSISLQKTIL